MAGTYNANAVVQQLADAVAMDPKLKGELYARYLERAATQHNAFDKFTSMVDRKTGMAGGVRSIFAKKRDLKAAGADTVNFNVIGTPGGPGVMGSEELTGKTSRALMATYPVQVGWHRDGFEMTKEQVEFLSAGRSLEATTLDLLGKKMGIRRQNHMMMRLIKSVDGNIYRPNNRANTNALLATDTLSLDMVPAARARLRTIGGQPIKHRLGKNGSPIDGYLIFATDMAMLPIRNDDGFQTAVGQGHRRGDDNANFSGDLLDWQGMPFYEFPSVDEAWDDYIGSPILPKAKLGVAFSVGSAIGDCVLKGSSTNTLSRYFQFFNGYGFKFNEADSPTPDATEYYAWVLNPNGRVGFIAYTGSGNDGNKITVTKILATAAGTSTLGTKVIGEVTLGTTPTVVSNVITPDSDTNLPTTGFVYTDAFQEGALVIQANSKGVPIGRTFVFGAMAACFATGRIDISPIEQTRDFGFTIGRGYEMIFGTGVTKNPLKKPAGYLLIEHAVEHEGYPVPVIDLTP